MRRSAISRAPFSGRSCSRLKNRGSNKQLRRCVRFMRLDPPIRKTAEECGISSPAAFCRQRKSWTGPASTLEDAALQIAAEADEAFFGLSFKSRRLRKPAADLGEAQLDSRRRRDPKSSRPGSGRHGRRAPPSTDSRRRERAARSNQGRQGKARRFEQAGRHRIPLRAEGSGQRPGGHCSAWRGFLHAMKNELSLKSRSSALLIKLRRRQPAAAFAASRRF